MADEAWKLSSEAKGGSGAGAKGFGFGPFGAQPGRLCGQVGVEDGMYTCSISVGSRKARKLESRKFLKL